MDVYRNMEVHSCNHWYCEKTINVTYSESVFVALVIEHAMHMRRIVVCCLPGSTVFFFPHIIS